MDEQRFNMYKDMLLELSPTIDSDDLQRMKFRCDKIIKKRQSEKINQPTDLFTALEERGYQSVTDVTFLRELLSKCCAGKTDGLRILDAYGQRYIPSYDPLVQHPPAGPLRTDGPQVVYVVPNNPNLEPRFTRGRYEGPDLSKQISFLCQKLGRDWKFFIRALGVPEDEIENISLDYRTVREKIHQCLLSWQHQEQQNASQDKLIQALRHSSVQRNDLASKLEEGGY